MFQSVVSSSPTLPPSVPGERLYALDAVRAVALLIGICFHGVESLVSFIPPLVWAVKDTQHSVIIDGFVYVAHVFRMQAFFMVSGFFAHLLYHRRGANGFLSHRAKRIALPFVLFWPLIFAAIQLLWIWGYQQMGYLAMDPTTAKLSYWEIVADSFTSFSWMAGGFPLTHLWFLYFLILFCAGVLLVRPLLANVLDRAGTIRAGLDNLVSFGMTRWWGSVLIGLLTIAPMWGMKNGFGVDTPDHGLVPLWSSFLVYGFYFTFGWLLHRQRELLNGFKKYWRANLLLSLGLVGLLTVSFLSVAYQPSTTPAAAEAMPLLTLAYNSLYGIAAMTSVFAFTGSMMTFFARPSQRIRYLSDASYWLYLIHLPVVVFFQIMVAPYPWHWLVKVILILLPSFTILLLSYQYGVRRTWIGKLLNGRTYP